MATINSSQSSSPPVANGTALPAPPDPSLSKIQSAAMHVFTAPSAAISTSASPTVKTRKFEATLSIGSDTYKISTQVPDTFTDAYLQSLLPHLTQAIEETLKKVPADKFDMEFTPAGINAAPYNASGAKSTPVAIPNTQILSSNVLRIIQVPVTAAKLSSVPSPFPSIKNERNTCFLSAMTWVHLLNNPVVRQELAKIPRHDPRNTREENKALNILRAFLKKCDQWPTDRQQIQGIDALRWALYHLNPARFPSPTATTQEDVHEVWSYFSDLIFRDSKITKLARIEHTYKDSKGNQEVSAHLENNPGKIQIALGNQKKFPLADLIYTHLSTDPDHPIGAKYRGKTLVSAKTTWSSAPEQLDVQLKRFDNANVKNKTPVDAPLAFDLPKDLFEDGKAAHYQLRGVIIHDGATAQNGHYRALLRIPVNGQFHNYLYDDSGPQGELTDAEFLQLAEQGYEFLYVKAPENQQNSQAPTANPGSRIGKFISSATSPFRKAFSCKKTK